jgi:hypothetical protein
MKNKKANIQCPINLFPRQEEQILRLTQAINQARSARQKVPYAQALIEVVNVLRDCESYDEHSLDCRLCRSFSLLRQKTARLIVIAEQIDEKRGS